MKRVLFPSRRRSSGFTLIELLTVLAIVAVLMGLLFPAVSGVMDQAKKTQARNDIMQTIIAVKGFYTEYSRYPDVAPDGVVDTPAESKVLFDILRKKEADTPEMQNPRGIVFYEAKMSKTDPAKNGIGTDGALYDPWGSMFKFAIDIDYDNQVDVDALDGVPPTGNKLDTGVAGSSPGKDAPRSNLAKDDVTSW